ncbi:MAG: lipoyl synthase [Hyphomicrobiales bacterium]
METTLYKRSFNRKPKWLKTQVPSGKEYIKLKKLVEENNLHTICTSGKCPNMNECWGAGTATFMILGDICTRSCKFCAVKTGKPNPVDLKEPERVAQSVKIMKVKHCVITSVDRDDLPDGGSQIWNETVLAIKETNPNTTIETLIPDFWGRESDIKKVIDANPEVISHNLETVERLTSLIRSKARYQRSLKVLKQIADSGKIAKSGIMVGIGESEEEVIQTMKDLRQVGVTVMTIGQYMQPTKDHLEVHEYITPEQFERYRLLGIELGFKHIESSPLVRSSYHAEKHV